MHLILPPQAAARNAVKTLNDVQNWRSGLRVRLVYKGAVHKTQQVRTQRTHPSGRHALTGPNAVPPAPMQGHCAARPLVYNSCALVIAASFVRLSVSYPHVVGR